MQPASYSPAPVTSLAFLLLVPNNDTATWHATEAEAEAAQEGREEEEAEKKWVEDEEAAAAAAAAAEAEKEQDDFGSDWGASTTVKKKKKKKGVVIEEDPPPPPPEAEYDDPDAALFDRHTRRLALSRARRGPQDRTHSKNFKHALSLAL
ncbi:hypothetical protein HBI23_246710 [Parastagonospora nodorum]|nr:hypothetical protein HBI23_246710 [Parastagonospora nodorum]KAH5622257.1 hypothetical protein HBI51_247730 [Parastagonospora nodorum]KAH5983582.1 hypothetical protein HBI84_245210 [Parastagonospora nodorum]KAH6134185.1 hypothetical protein HBI68_248600 [Parastagonospora nodorum]KAH6383979.1 hypothetical protein HBI60_251530 [Parastagonospora nodorum]